MAEADKNLLQETVTRRWPELAAYALSQCADGYNRGYVLLDSAQAAPRYVVVPDRALSSSETTAPYTLEGAVLVPHNCEDFVVIAMTASPSLVWDVFSKVDGVTLQEAAQAGGAG